MDAYDLYVADLHGRPNTLTRENFFAIYGDLLPVAPANPTAFIQGSINYGQFGDVGSISIDPFSGQTVVVRNQPEPDVAVYRVPVPDPVAGGGEPTFPTVAAAAPVVIPGGDMLLYTDPRGYTNLSGPMLATSIGTAGPVADSALALKVNWGKVASITGGLLGGVVGGPAGATIGSGIGGGIASIFASDKCSNGKVKNSQGMCVSVAAGPFGGGGGGGGGGGVPVGQVVTPADVQVRLGLYGAAMTPFQIGNIGGRPILRCPVRGLVLGRDGLCYNKRDLHKDQRKWAPTRKPPMTGAEAHTLRTMGGLKTKAKKLAQLAGYSCATRGRTQPKKGKR
jgi:hypothetical protein